MIDLRSDTLTLPDRAMLEAILAAPLGDDGREDTHGRGEDTTVNRLEDMAADLTGKEAAVFFPSGTLANSAAILTWCKAGDIVLVDKEQHILLSEKYVFEPGYGDLIPLCYQHHESHMPIPAEIDWLLEKSGSKLVCLENSHNFSGGYCIDLTTMKAIRETADKHGASIHLDGARVFHAAAHLNCAVSEICQYVDSAMFCVSKGLGAPIGSLLCGSEEFCRKARKARKLLGGGMRQSGVVAAPAIYALEHNVKRLAEDIEHTKLIHRLLKENLKKIRVQEEVQTNILMLDVFDTGINAEEFCSLTKKEGLLIRPVLNDVTVRLVLYKGITAEAAEMAANIILKLDAVLVGQGMQKSLETGDGYDDKNTQR